MQSLNIETFNRLTQSKQSAKAYALAHCLSVHYEDNDVLEITDYARETPLFWGIDYAKNTFCGFSIENINNIFKILNMATFAEPTPTLILRNREHLNDITVEFTNKGEWCIEAYAEEIS